MLIVYLNKNEEKEKLEGYPWIFNNEVNHFDGEIKSGDVCEVKTLDNRFVAYGWLNTSSKIMVRILSLNKEDKIDEEFYRRRIIDAVEHRKNIGFYDTCRLIFSEADFLPGLVVDKYGDYLCIQISSLGIEMIKDMIIKLLVEIVNPKGIYERSDSPSRLKEGLELSTGIIYGDFNPKVMATENGVKFYVDMENGQKTGYFLDQKMNREMVKFYSKDRVVLDCFSNVGGFALQAAKNGAKHVIATDISGLACEEIMNNAKLNGFTNIEAVKCDVFNFLRDKENYNKFDTIILDPPAFTKDKDSVKNATKGYKEINLQAMKMIKRGGYLLTFSCSQHMKPDMFLSMLEEAAKDSKRTIQFVDFRVQAMDHLMLLSGDEKLYLKCVVLRVL